MPAITPTASVGRETPHSVNFPLGLFEPLDSLISRSSNLASWRSFKVDDELVPSYVFIGPRGGSVPIRLALMGGVAAGDIVSSTAVAKLLLELDLAPLLAQDYALFGFPVVNPERRDGREPDFEKDFWRNSPDPVVSFFERELSGNELDGVIGVFCDQPVHGFQVDVCSRVIATEVLWPAIEFAQRLVPLAADPIRLFSTAQKTPEAFWDLRRMKPRPFCMTIRTPRNVPFENQVAAISFSVKQILYHYRSLIAHAESL